MTGAAMKIFRYVLLTGLILNHVSANATSFDCNKGHSIAERLICHTPELSKLDDQLGKLYWKARRAAPDRRAFIADSDSKWAWREAHCSDDVCLTAWYTGRIAELQQSLSGVQQPDAPAPSPVIAPQEKPQQALAGAPLDEAPPARPQTRKAEPSHTAANHEPLVQQKLPRQCTATDLGMTWHEQCPTVLQQNTAWRRQDPDDSWFCKVAMVGPLSEDPDVDQ